MLLDGTVLVLSIKKDVISYFAAQNVLLLTTEYPTGKHTCSIMLITSFLLLSNLYKYQLNTLSTAHYSTLKLATYATDIQPYGPK